MPWGSAKSRDHLFVMDFESERERKRASERARKRERKRERKWETEREKEKEVEIVIQRRSLITCLQPVENRVFVVIYICSSLHHTATFCNTLHHICSRSRIVFLSLSFSLSVFSCVLVDLGQTLREQGESGSSRSRCYCEGEKILSYFFRVGHAPVCAHRRNEGKRRLEQVVFPQVKYGHPADEKREGKKDERKNGTSGGARRRRLSAVVLWHRKGGMTSLFLSICATQFTSRFVFIRLWRDTWGTARMGK